MLLVQASKESEIVKVKTVIQSEQCVFLGNNHILVQAPSCVMRSSGRSASAFGMRTGKVREFVCGLVRVSGAGYVVGDSVRT